MNRDNGSEKQALKNKLQENNIFMIMSQKMAVVIYLPLDLTIFKHITGEKIWLKNHHRNFQYFL